MSDKSLHGFFPSKFHFPQTALENPKNKFGYLFTTARTAKNDLHDNQRNRDKLVALGQAMRDNPALGIDNAKIPAGYTYLGQFIDHDITLTPSIDINGFHNARDLTNLRTPNLDLDSVYGNGPIASPNLYQADGIKLRIGTNQNVVGGAPTDFDLPREADGTAIIGDFRNDENLFVAQLHLGWLKFHNAVVDHVIANGLGGGDVFAAAKEIVVQHYQHVVIHDYLKTICGKETVDDILNNGFKIFTKEKFKTFFMPAEFAFACYRFGHSMVRDTYDTNNFFPNSTFNQIFEFTGRRGAPVPNNWIVDWKRFFKVGNRNPENVSRNIDTQVANELFQLPGETINFMKMLSARNLLRGMSVRLPSGQFCATALGVATMTKNELFTNLMPVQKDILEADGGLFLRKTPLWFYTLKEAEVKCDGKHLGPVGGRIVAETFIRMWHDSTHFDAGFSPNLGPSAGSFNISHMLAFANMMDVPAVS